MFTGNWFLPPCAVQPTTKASQISWLIITASAVAALTDPLIINYCEFPFIGGPILRDIIVNGGRVLVNGPRRRHENMADNLVICKAVSVVFGVDYVSSPSRTVDIS